MPAREDHPNLGGTRVWHDLCIDLGRAPMQRQSQAQGDVMEQAEQRPGGTVRLAAVGDVHCTKNSQGVLQPIFASVR